MQKGESGMRRQTALLILDAQVNMLEGATAVHAAAELLAKVRGLISWARRSGATVVYVQNEGGPGDPDQPGTPGWEIHPDIAPRAGDVVIRKASPDAFEGTPLRSELQARGVKDLIIAGMQTELCINATCRSASRFGYDVTLVEDAHSTFDREDTRAEEIIDQYNRELGAVAKRIRARSLHS